MTLGQKQRAFTQMIARLIDFAYANGYELTFGDAYRDPRVHGAVGEKKSYSSAVSLHKERLAVDFNLFKGGKYMTASEDYRELGEFWESIGGTWGGRFNDGNCIPTSATCRRCAWTWSDGSAMSCSWN